MKPDRPDMPANRGPDPLNATDPPPIFDFVGSFIVVLMLLIFGGVVGALCAAAWQTRNL